MKEKKVKQVCECTHCGNEAEMVVTCTLSEESADQGVSQGETQKKEGKVKGHAVCTHCGGEADIWLDL